MKLREVLPVAVLALAVLPWVGANAAKYDVMELPAVPSEMATKSLIYSLNKFGDRYFATGHHGHILYSDDGGESWTQAEVPVRSSILDVDFATPELGWAVGHEGVILHSSDGGATWAKQYDGLRYGEEGLAFYQKLAESEPDNELYPTLVEEMEFAISQGADKPLFKVGFHSETYGHAFGAYGMILVTRDGGQNWEPALHRVENESFFHLFDFSPLPEEGKFFINGEAGLFLVGSTTDQTARQIENVPWAGSFFTSLAAADGSILVGGLRGRMFYTEDAGESWVEVTKPPSSAIVDTALLEDGRIVAAGIGGDMLISKDNGRTFGPLAVSAGGWIFAVVEGPKGTLVIGGPNGLKKLTLPQ